MKSPLGSLLNQFLVRMDPHTQKPAGAKRYRRGGGECPFILAYSVHQGYIKITHDPLLFSVCKEYFDCLRETLTQYITFNLAEGGVGSRYSCILKFCNHDVLHRPLCEDSEKIPEGRTSTYILHLSGVHISR